MTVGILDRIAVEDIAARHLDEILRHIGRVGRDEYVRHDTAAAVYDLSTRSHPFERIGKMNAVGRKKLVVLIAVIKVLFVVSVIADRVGFLDRTARRGIVTRRRQPQGRTVAVRYLALHEAFAERTASDDRTPVVILQRSGENLARRGASFVDQHHDLHILRLAFAVGVFAHLLVVTVFGIDDQLALVQELVGHGDRLVEKSARVAPQVEDQLRHTLGAQRGECPVELVERTAGKLSQLDVPYAVGDAESRFDTLDRNHAAHDIDLDQVGDTLPFEAQVNRRTARTAQFLDDIVLGNLAPGDKRIVDLDDPVAGLDPGLVARALGNDIQHDDRVGSHVKDHTDTVELPFEGFVQSLHLRNGDIDRVGIELLDQHRDDVLGQRIHRHRIDILVLDQRERIGEFVVGQRHAAEHALELRGRGIAAQILAQQQAQNHPRGQQQREEDGMFRVFIHHIMAFRTPVPYLIFRNDIRSSGFRLVLEGVRQAHAQQCTDLHIGILRPVVIKLEI